jgi:GNAT superfamily N-acetyltransferase
MTEIVVRVGVPEDVHAMMALAMAACDDNGLTDADPSKILQEIWSALNRHFGIVGSIGEPNKPIEAAILLRTDQMWYSSELHLVERAVFVHPDYRAAKGGRAARLCEFAKKAASSLGMPLVIGVISSNRADAKVRLYERQFGKQSGAYFLYNGVTGSEKVGV